MEEQEQKDRRKNCPMLPACRSAIAQEAAELIWQQIYEDTGRTALRIVKYLAWAACLSLLGWLGIHGQAPKIGE